MKKKKKYSRRKTTKKSRNIFATCEFYKYLSCTIVKINLLEITKIYLKSYISQENIYP